MPSYKVMKPGFHNGVLCKPGCPRHGVVTTDKPFPKDPKTKKEKIPSWLEPIKAESAAAKKKRAAAAKKAAEAKKDDDEQIENASFMNGGEGGNGSVETL